MTPGEKQQLCRQVRESLGNSPVKDSLPKRWENQLFARHLEHPERSSQICTTVSLDFGLTTGWFTLEQAGGGFLAHIWAPGARESKEVEKEARDLGDHLLSVLPASCVRVRFAKPHEFLSRKGWSVPNGI